MTSTVLADGTSGLCCDNCGRTAADKDILLVSQKTTNPQKKKLLRCTVCGFALYCSVNCQKQAWKNHRKGCSEKGTQALIRAIRDDDIAAVQRLSKTSRVVNGRVCYQDETQNDFEPMEKWTALHECVRCNKPELMKILLQPEKKAKVDIQDQDGEPSHLSCVQQCRNIKAATGSWSESKFSSG